LLRPKPLTNMKATLPIAILLALTAPTAFGQYSRAIQRAHQVVDENNVRQGVPSPAQTAPAAPKTSGAPSNYVTQAQSLAALQHDLAGFKPGTPVTTAQRQQLTVDLAKAGRGPKPTLETLNKFVGSLTAAWSDAILTPEQQARLAADLDAVLNSRALSAAQFDKIIADTQAILQVGTIKRSQAQSIVADLKAVGAEVRR
jgi:hypothetical protein